jgi:hypothetical protein
MKTYAHLRSYLASDETRRENRSTYFKFSAVYEIMRKNVIEPEGLQMTIYAHCMLDN